MNVEQRCRDYIALHISEIYHMIPNMTRTLDVSVFFCKYCGGMLKRHHNWAMKMWSC